MAATILTGIVSVLGIVSTVIAWRLNPRRILYSELDSLFKRLDKLYKERDEALSTNDSDTLTIITADIIRVCQRKTILLQRLG